jgi:hypothetical protein
LGLGYSMGLILIKSVIVAVDLFTVGEKNERMYLSRWNTRLWSGRMWARQGDTTYK